MTSMPRRTSSRLIVLIALSCPSQMGTAVRIRIGGIRLILLNPAGGMFSISCGWREMFCEQRPDPLDTMHKGIGEVSVLKARAHCFDHLIPETISAFRVNPDVANDRKFM